MILFPRDPSPAREAKHEIEWDESVLRAVRRPYPIQVPCPVCGTTVRCSFLGRQRCPLGHAFAQRAFWDGRENCCLLLEDLHDRRLLLYPRAEVRWDEGVHRILA